MNQDLPVLIITGPVGIGKTSVAWEVSEILEDQGINHSFVDADVCYLFPKPENDPRGLDLYLKNLRSIWTNLKGEGAEKLILTKVIESQTEIEQIRQTLPNSNIKVIRLHAPIETVTQRLGKREIGAGLEWHKQRAINFLDIWEKNSIDADLIQTNHRGVREIAQEILEKTKWI